MNATSRRNLLATIAALLIAGAAGGAARAPTTWPG